MQSVCNLPIESGCRGPYKEEGPHISSAWSEYFRVFLRFFLVAELPPKEVFSHTRIHSLLVNGRHSVGSRALTCPFKECNLSA